MIQAEGIYIGQVVGIHPSAVIEEGATLGENVAISPFCYIDRHVQLGAGCVLGPHVTILGHTTLGKDCRVHGGAIIGDIPQDVTYQGGVSYVTIGDRCILREGVTIHRGTKPEAVTQVGNDCLLMAHSHLAHDVQIGNQVIIANGALVAGYAHIGDRAFISGNCLIHQFTRVGRLAMLSGGTAVQKDVPPFAMTHSLSRNTIMGLNVVGLRRAGFTTEERQLLKAAFTILYRSDLNTTQAIAQLKDIFHSPLVTELWQFIETSQRGICNFIR